MKENLTLNKHPDKMFTSFVSSNPIHKCSEQLLDQNQTVSLLLQFLSLSFCSAEVVRMVDLLRSKMYVFYLFMDNQSSVFSTVSQTIENSLDLTSTNLS